LEVDAALTPRSASLNTMPIHIAITRRVKPGCEAEFQQALREFFQTSFAHGGVLGATMIVPPPGSDSREFGILRTFADEKERDDFYASPVFKTWEEKCAPLTESDSWTYRELHGLEAWFRSPGRPQLWVHKTDGEKRRAVGKSKDDRWFIVDYPEPAVMPPVPLTTSARLPIRSTRSRYKRAS
jgi:quinol monooxygenase YgiN